MSDEIWVVPFFGQGHLLPTMELCKHIASRNFKTTLIINSDLAISIPSSFREYPLIQVTELSSSNPEHNPSSSDPFQHHFSHHSQMAQGIQNLISSAALPVCAIIDVMMGWLSQIFIKHDIQIVSFFTSGACSAAMEYAMWKINASSLDLKPGEIRLLPGLPQHMALTDSDLKTRPHGLGPPPAGPAPHPGPHPGHTATPIRPPGVGPQQMGLPKPGGQPPWLEESKDSIALMINSCNLLEHPFIEYLANQIGKPVWGVGPLLPQQYWKSPGSIVHDHELRANRKSMVSENDVIEWLNSKKRASVVFVSFGSEVGPTMEEYPHLADALEALNQPFIWVIQQGSSLHGPTRQGNTGRKEGYFPHGLQERVGNRGMIIHGWAPQLLILSHPSTGGFLSHCGWNSSVEAIGRGVPMLAWPIRGDQYINAQLIVRHLRVGYKICDDFSKMVTSDDIVKGIEMLMEDDDVKNRAKMLAAEFQHDFPATSSESLDAFKDFVMSVSLKRKENTDF